MSCARLIATTNEGFTMKHALNYFQHNAATATTNMREAAQRNAQSRAASLAYLNEHVYRKEPRSEHDANVALRPTFT